jgi:putative nucleotidyltransferase with HDIG domain
MADGRIKYVNERCENFYDESGEPLRSIGTVQDITAQRLTEIALSRVNRALRTLSAGNEVLVRTSDEETLLRDMCRVIVESGGYRMAWVGYAEDDAAKTVRPVAQFGPAEGYVENLNLTWDEADPRGRGPTGTAIRTHRPVVALDIANEPTFAPWRDAALKRGLGSSIALPLIENGRTLGSLNIYAAEPVAFDEQEISLLQELASDLAYGIFSLRTRQERHNSEARLRENLVETIRAVSRTVEKRDPYTAGHQQRVAELVVAIAQELGLDAGRIEGLRLGALIHDIGKIYVPAEILNRPGMLTEAEFTIIKSHPQVGYDIVKDVHFPWPLAQMILQHHERLDGSGYPNGLKGEAILLEARILAVADVVEAMAAHRPYRAARGPETALDEIRTNRGLLYDPVVVDACLRLFEEKGYAWPQAGK